MSTAMNFSAKSFKPRPPDKGAFPLDHFGHHRKGDEKISRNFGASFALTSASGIARGCPAADELSTSGNCINSIRF
ncbi:Cox19 [Columba livia]|nr:Cox19 [Columba livia]